AAESDLNQNAHIQTAAAQTHTRREDMVFSGRDSGERSGEKRSSLTLYRGKRINPAHIRAGVAQWQSVGFPSRRSRVRCPSPASSLIQFASMTCAEPLRFRAFVFSLCCGSCTTSDTTCWLGRVFCPVSTSQTARDESRASTRSR